MSHLVLHCNPGEAITFHTKDGLIRIEIFMETLYKGKKMSIEAPASVKIVRDKAKNTQHRDRGGRHEGITNG